MPATAGIHGAAGTALPVAHPFDPTMDPRFRGGDERNADNGAKISSLEPFKRLPWLMAAFALLAAVV
jgi:hypothetical protein